MTIAKAKNIGVGKGEGSNRITFDQNRVIHIETLQNAYFRGNRGWIGQGFRNLVSERGGSARKLSNIWQVVHLAGAAVKFYTQFVLSLSDDHAHPLVEGVNLALVDALLSGFGRGAYEVFGAKGV